MTSLPLKIQYFTLALLYQQHQSIVIVVIEIMLRGRHLNCAQKNRNFHGPLFVSEFTGHWDQETRADKADATPFSLAYPKSDSNGSSQSREAQSSLSTALPGGIPSHS